MNNKPILFQCPEDLKVEATKKLQECGISMSEFLRTCLEVFIQKQASKNIKHELVEVAHAVANELAVP